MKKVTDKQFWMHDTLRHILDSYVYDMAHDYSFTIIISGEGKVRVGKSVLASQVGYYLSYELNRKWDYENCYNVIWSSKELEKKARESPPTVFQYDEGRINLNSKMSMTEVCNDLLNFVNVCGKYNHILIIVIADYFDLVKQLATNLSDCLINVIQTKEVRDHTRKDGEQIKVKHRLRGTFLYYNEQAKRKLYFKGKKEHHNYNAVKHTFWGNFREPLMYNENNYNKLKTKFMETYNIVKSNNKYLTQRNAIIKAVYEQLDLTHEDIRLLIKQYGVKMTRQNITEIIANT